jgi:hypothetical protein
LRVTRASLPPLQGNLAALVMGPLRAKKGLILFQDKWITSP